MSSFDRVIEMVYEKNRPTYPLNPNSVSLNDLTVEAAPTHNTRITMVARNRRDGGYSGQVDLFYTRVPLSALGRLAFWREEPYRYEDIFPLINQSKIAQMGPEDFTNEGLPPMERGVPVKFILSARDGSLAWLGNTQVELLIGVPAIAPAFDNFWKKEAGALFAAYAAQNP